MVMKEEEQKVAEKEEEDLERLLSHPLVTRTKEAKDFPELPLPFTCQQPTPTRVPPGLLDHPTGSDWWVTRRTRAL